MSVTVGTVRHLHLILEHRGTPRSVPEVTAIVDRGLEGDIHSRKPRGRRQVLLVDASVLAAVGLRPGDLREQITVDFPALDSIPVGTTLRIGQATVEVTGPCEPCTHIGTLAGVGDPAVLQAALEGRRGQLVRVVAIEGDGRIQVGDPVATVDARDATRP